jgi:hypothetical protein
MDDKEAKAIADAITERIQQTPNDYYISDDGKTLYALLAGSYLWSMKATTGMNFHLMTEAKIALEIHNYLSVKLD